MHALRRTPAIGGRALRPRPAGARILCAICRTADGNEVAVVLLGGDKTVLGNNWYPVNLNEAEARLDNYCRQRADASPIVKRGNR